MGYAVKLQSREEVFPYIWNMSRANTYITIDLTSSFPYKYVFVYGYPSRPYDVWGNKNIIKDINFMPHLMQAFFYNGRTTGGDSESCFGAYDVTNDLAGMSSCEFKAYSANYCKSFLFEFKKPITSITRLCEPPANQWALYNAPGNIMLITCVSSASYTYLLGQNAKGIYCIDDPTLPVYGYLEDSNGFNWAFPKKAHNYKIAGSDNINRAVFAIGCSFS